MNNKKTIKDKNILYSGILENNSGNNKSPIPYKGNINIVFH